MWHNVKFVVGFIKKKKNYVTMFTSSGDLLFECDDDDDGR